MEHSKFLQLVKGGERANVDFKIHCDAFASKAKAPKAELAKDICAMANNGGVTGYIVIGVSDDGQSFESVANTELTDEHLQDFCKTAIFPAVRVKLQRQRWTRVSADHAGKQFVIIQVGPHARQPFRLARDFIDYGEGVCYRRNEVWIRRESTTDLASPEEVARLVKGLPPEGHEKPQDNVQYERLPRRRRLDALRRDFRLSVEAAGGLLCDEGTLAIEVNGVRYVWRYVPVSEVSRTAGFSLIGLSEEWRYEHALLLLSIGNASRKALELGTDVLFRQPWGWFACSAGFWSGLALGDVWHAGRPRDERSIPIMTLMNLRDTDAVRSSFLQLLEFVGKDQDAAKRLRQAREALNADLRRYVQANGAFLREHARGDKPPKPSAARKSGIDQLTERRLACVRSAQRVLALARGNERP